MLVCGLVELLLFLAGLMFEFGLVIRLKMLLETEECFIKASGGVKKPLYV